MSATHRRVLHKLHSSFPLAAATSLASMTTAEGLYAHESLHIPAALGLCRLPRIQRLRCSSFAVNRSLTGVHDRRGREDEPLRMAAAPAPRRP